MCDKSLTHPSADGASQCVELMGCFSALEVQIAAAKVCTKLAHMGEDACATLLDSDIGSMLQQHIKEREASLVMFENAALLLAALAEGSGEVCSCAMVWAAVPCSIGRPTRGHRW